MYVYRVEHEDPRVPYGPYNCGVAIKPHLYDDDHPSPAQSGIEMERDDFSCFTKKEDLTKWFKASDLSFFRKLGFETFRYEVKTADVKFGDKQAAFKKDRAFKREKVTLH